MNKLRILIACEESQTVCKAFRDRGHEAYSCDIQACSGGYPQWHLQIDVFAALMFGHWDIVIMHPPCTKIAVSGNRWYGKGMPLHNERIESVEWTVNLWHFALSVCDKVVMENPVGVLNQEKTLPTPQYIQPWQFGHKQMKKTGLWISGLPHLKPTDIVGPAPEDYRERLKWQDCWMASPGPERAKIRSKTYEGIARAMAEQWSENLTIRL